MKFKRQSKNESPVDVTPLIDVVFLLVIFFMVSTTFTKETHLEIDLPEASGEPATAQTQQVEVVIDANGEMSVNERPLINNEEETLLRAVEELSGGNSELPFIITADAQTPHEFVVRAMDVAGQLGFVKLSITTRRPVEDEG